MYISNSFTSHTHTHTQTHTPTQTHIHTQVDAAWRYSTPCYRSPATDSPTPWSRSPNADVSLAQPPIPMSPLRDGFVFTILVAWLLGLLSLF